MNARRRVTVGRSEETDRRSWSSTFVIAGPVPAIQGRSLNEQRKLDARDRPGHDKIELFRPRCDC
ncbi:hypothetical protein C5L14_05545 [Labrys okinawensis]|uniref:Uncharacterized protein n=1 Tax=Labrys okinawensis TaxID=346911 RepID=A0A2S9QH56_9HYPH|nr:hypothetical protein C5L14_05545 [Labrys okinawensis]